MKFEFTARAETLGYATNTEVEEQARKYLSDPDMLIFALEIGTWEPLLIKEREVIIWQAKVTVHVDDGCSATEPVEPGRPVIWEA